MHACLSFRCNLLPFIITFRSFQRLVPITEICSADLKSISDTVLKRFLPDKDSKGCASVSIDIR